ncbi:uncharacterized protein [Montipora foliosa]|uniref:uncharacterized protein n=1 Tax=Montipora foliosa TaxID=591990 RepID=UPI0035F1EE83
MTKIWYQGSCWYPVLPGQPRSNVGWDSRDVSVKESLNPEKKRTCLAGSDSTDEDDEIYVRAPLCESFKFCSHLVRRPLTMQNMVSDLEALANPAPPAAPVPAVVDPVLPAPPAPPAQPAGSLGGQQEQLSEAAARIKILEDKIKSLEQLKTLESSESALAALRRHISRPTAMFDKYEALDLLQSLVCQARNESHKKADAYAAALDEIRAGTDALDHLQLQRLFSGYWGILFVLKLPGKPLLF